jgi:hypothetical protein
MNEQADATFGNTSSISWYDTSPWQHSSRYDDDLTKVLTSVRSPTLSRRTINKRQRTDIEHR